MIIKDAKEQYTNMLSDWNKVDPHDAQLLALTTELQDAKAKFVLLTNAVANDNKGKGGSSGPGKGMFAEEWQFVNEGDSKLVKGKTWWWCSQHNDGKGMYVRHPPSDHAEWLRCKNSDSERYISPDNRKSSPPDPNNSDTPSAPTTLPASTLELGSELKQVLASFGMSDNDADEAWALTKERVSRN